jgi:hypothetical protein
LVGAIAPVTSLPSRRASGLGIRLAPFSALTAQHNTYPGVSLPHFEGCTPQAKTPRRRIATLGTGDHRPPDQGHNCRQLSHTVPAPHRYAGAVPVAHRHRVFLI